MYKADNKTTKSLNNDVSCFSNIIPEITPYIYIYLFFFFFHFYFFALCPVDIYLLKINNKTTEKKCKIE